MGWPSKVICLLGVRFIRVWRKHPNDQPTNQPNRSHTGRSLRSLDHTHRRSGL